MTSEQKNVVASILRRKERLLEMRRRVRDGLFVRSRRGKLDRIENALDGNDELLVEFAVSCCRWNPNDRLRSHLGRVYGSAVDLLRRFKGVEASEEDAFSDEGAMAFVASGDTPERQRWFCEFLGLFENLSMAPDWRLSAITRSDGLSGRAEFFAVCNEVGSWVERNPFDCILVSGDPELGAAEAALLDFVIGQVDLSWHSLYRVGYFVDDICFFAFDRRKQLVRDIVLQMAERGEIARFCDCDFEPRVEFVGEGRYKVSFMECSPHIGFARRTTFVDEDEWSLKIEAKVEPLFEYDSPIRY